MAMPFSTTELNRVVDEIVASATDGPSVFWRPRGGRYSQPDRNGQRRPCGCSTGRLQRVALSETTPTADLGVLDADSEQRVTHGAVFRANAFLFSFGLPIDIDDNMAGVPVVAGGTFKFNTGTIRIEGSTT